MANEAMQAAWNGDEGEHWAEHADWYDEAATRVRGAYLSRIETREADRILDIGCGAGSVALELGQRVPSGSVLGVDLSSQMLDVAAKRAAAAGLTNVTFERADAQTHDFAPASFDLAVSSFGVMFFDDPVAAFTNVGRALAPGGRVSFIAWQGLTDNAWLMGVRGALAMGRDLPVPPLEAPTPFSLSDPDRTKSLFAAAGFADVELTAVHQPMVLGKSGADAFRIVSGIGVAKGLTEDLDAATKRQALDNLQQFLTDHESADGVLVDSAAWVISARKPG
jgi:SAM-dependent methyltransferase